MLARDDPEPLGTPHLYFVQTIPYLSHVLGAKESVTLITTAKQFIHGIKFLFVYPSSLVDSLIL